MKKAFLLSFILLLSLTGCKNNSKNENNNLYSTNFLSLNSNTNTFKEDENNQNNFISNEFIAKPKEEIISVFTTNILDKSSARQNNISLACSKLNGTIVKPGATFSFCNVLGPATPEAGYQKADSFDKDGDIYKEYGGGKCQVSSTLYNAVLKIPTLEVVERHPHSGKVYYVESGKDAAVAHGSVDFKFRNSNNYTIRIDASTNQETVTISLVKI